MFRENKQTQTNLLTDSYLLTSERAQKMIEQSWAGSFAQIIFPSINETRFDVLYHEDNGRPNTPINYVLGALILKETLGLKDEDLILRCHTDICFQHALHSTSWEEQPVSDRTFSRFRRACYLYEIETGIDLIQEEMEGLTDKLITYFNVNHTQKRMDSVMIASNTKRLSQLELLYTCVEKLIRTIDKEFSTFDISEFEHYLKASHHNQTIYHSDQPHHEKLALIMKDAYKLIDLFSSDDIKEHPDYHLLCRVLNEQTKKDEEGKVTVKKGKEISPSSLQTPYEPEATYRFKSGEGYIGYIANIVETVDEDYSFITQYSFDTNLHSDAAYAYETIEKLGKQKELTTIVADGAYDNEEAKALGHINGIDLITTDFKGRKPNPAYLGIEIDEEKKEVIQLPHGVKPLRSTYYPKEDKYRVVIDNESYQQCPDNLKKLMKHLKHTKYFIVSPMRIRRAEEAERMKEKDFSLYANFRNGIEGVPSVLRRKYNVDCMPFKGLVCKKHCLGIKLLAINVKKAIKYKQNRERIA